MATAAAIDRVVHHSVILEFDVPSYRTDAAQQRGQAEGVNRQIWLTRDIPGLCRLVLQHQVQGDAGPAPP